MGPRRLRLRLLPLPLRLRLHSLLRRLARSSATPLPLLLLSSRRLCLRSLRSALPATTARSAANLSQDHARVAAQSTTALARVSSSTGRRTRPRSRRWRAGWCAGAPREERKNLSPTADSRAVFVMHATLWWASSCCAAPIPRVPWLMGESCESALSASDKLRGRRDD